jgi:hypothetical protein
VQYRVFDPARKSGVWVKLNERNAELGVMAKQYDADRGTLTVEHEGKTLTLEERKAKIVSAGPVAQMMAPPPPAAPGGNMAPAVTQSVVVNPTPAEEQKRLEAVAAEVARRRALREQAASQMPQGMVPPAGFPQIQPAAPQGTMPNQPPNQRRSLQNTR